MENLVKEQAVISMILERFPMLESYVHIQREKRVYIDFLQRRDFEKLFQFLSTDGGFHMLHVVLGTDEGENLGFIYTLSNAENIMLMVKQIVPKAKPNISSVCGRFENALWHERELVDLFGAVVENLPPGPTYPLPDGWPTGNYPMRKEWKVEYFDRDSMSYNPPPAKEALSEATEKEVE